MWLGISPTTIRIKRRSTLNPFGSYSSTGVRRGSRWPWIGRLLLNAGLIGLSIMLSLPYWWIGLLVVGIPWVLYDYAKWASPPCNVCGQAFTHMGGCEYDRQFRKYEAEGWYAL